MDRLNRALAKAGQIAQQFNDDVQRAREQQQQQQQLQAQYQQQNHRLSQQYHQFQAPSFQYQPTTHERPPPQPPRPSNQLSSTPQPYLQPQQSVYPKTSTSDYISKAEADLEQLKQQQREQLRLAEAEIARLRAEQEEHQRKAEREAQAARVDAQKLAEVEMKRLKQAAKEAADAEERQRRDKEAKKLEEGRLAAIELEMMRAEKEEEEREAERLVRQLEEDRRAAERLAAEFDAELREAEVGMERIRVAKKDQASRPPLPPRISQQQGAQSASGTSQPSTFSAVTPSTTAASLTGSTLEDNQAAGAHEAHTRRAETPAADAGRTETRQAETPQYLKLLPPLSPHPPTQHISGITPIRDCPGSAPLDITLQYLTHDAAPNFTICTRCYIDHIYPSPFKNSFSLLPATISSTTSPQGCFFGVDRVKEHLWPEAVATKSLRGLLEYMIKRPTIAACPKMEVVEGRVWYETGECEGLAICEACFEENLVGSKFEGKFKAYKAGHGVTCDMASIYVVRMYEKFSFLDDWKSFCKEAYARIRFPACPKNKTVTGHSWFYPKNGPQGLKICVGCFCDYFIDTASETEFVRVNDGSSAFSCSMGLVRIYMLAQEATRRKDHAIWWEKIHEIAANAPCDPAGTKTEKWYTLPCKPKGFAVCGGCMAGIVDPLSASSYFIPANDILSTQPCLCAFNESHPRMGRHLLLYLEMVLTGKDTSLSTFAHKLSHVNTCPRINYDKGKHKTWYGWPDAPICEECYHIFASPLHPSPPFHLNGEYTPDSRMCDLYSPRMRTLYKTACQTGDFNIFLQLARERRQVYIDCYMPAQRYLEEMEMAVLQAQNLGIQGTVYKSMGWSIEATQGHRYTVGNAAVGYGYENEFVLQGAVYDRQAADVRAGVMNPMKQARMNELMNRWLAVE